jgi:uracil phosphoribosyltransferase
VSGGLLVVDHPVVADRVTVLRDRTSDGATFRRVLGEVTTLLAYEALHDLATETRAIDTPVASAVAAPVLSSTIVIVPILRAGLGMVPAVQELVRLCDVAHIGLRRNETTLESELYLDRLPPDLAGRTVVVLDPMLATGGSGRATSGRSA